MTQFIFQQLLFFIAIALVMVVPGYFFMNAIRKPNQFNRFELGVSSIAASIVIVNFLMLLMGKLSIPLTRASLIGSIALFSFCAFGISHLYRRKHGKKAFASFPTLTRRQGLLLFAIIIATIAIKTIYLSGSIFPTSTDLGHHMYWSKLITTSGEIPVYEKVDVGFDNKLFTTPIADFIIGEHLIFAAIAMISGVSFVSAFPSLVLFFIHLAMLAALFMLVMKLFEKHELQITIALLSLFLLGPIFAIASPQMKFVSGGVVGNTIGNFFIPVLIYFFVRALQEKNSILMSLAIFFGLGLAYTHHLSTFVFIFIAIFTCFAHCILNHKTLWTSIKSWTKIVVHPAVIGVIIFGAVFVFSVYTPTYLNVKAVDTAVGSPTKSTRVGLTPGQLADTAGDARLALALLGLGILFLNRKRDDYGQAFLIGWAAALIIMSLRPQWLLIDIPSNRIASYVVFPVAIVASYSFAYLLKWNKDQANHVYLRPLFLVATFFLITTFMIQTGSKENTDQIGSEPYDVQSVIQVHAAATYLAQKTTADDIILKDHNYLKADSWIKLFFMRGYNYPLSRGYFKRYNDEAKKREMCTYYMITTPNSNEAADCFAGTGTDFLMVNPQFDSAQFKRSNEFWHVYDANDVSIYHKPQ